LGVSTNFWPAPYSSRPHPYEAECGAWVGCRRNALRSENRHSNERCGRAQGPDAAPFSLSIRDARPLLRQIRPRCHHVPVGHLRQVDLHFPRPPPSTCAILFPTPWLHTWGISGGVDFRSGRVHPTPPRVPCRGAWVAGRLSVGVARMTTAKFERPLLPLKGTSPALAGPWRRSSFAHLEGSGFEGYAHRSALPANGH
jgi:hypothetical protein